MKNEVGLLPLGSMFLYVIREEEQLEDNEDDEQLYKYDGPQRSPKRHTAEPIII